MRADHHAEVISLQEGVQVVRPKIDDVVLFLRIPHVVVLEPSDILALMRVTPEKVDDLLMVLALVRAKFNLKRSRDLLDALNVRDRRAQSPVAAEDSLLLISYNGRQWKVIKRIIDLREATVWVVDVFAESLGALICEAEVLVHVPVLMVAPEEHDLFWVFQLKGHQEADDLEAVVAFVDVVAQEKVVIRLNIARLLRRLPDIEETH